MYTEILKGEVIVWRWGGFVKEWNIAQWFRNMSIDKKRRYRQGTLFYLPIFPVIAAESIVVLIIRQTDFRKYLPPSLKETP